MDVMHERVMSLIPERRGGVKEFAEKIGVPANLVSMWRKGDSFSYKNYLSKISSEYNVSIDWLCGNVEQKENPTEIPGEVNKNDISELLEKMSTPDLIDLLGEITENLKRRGKK